MRNTGEGEDELRKLKKILKYSPKLIKLENIKSGVYFYKTDGLIFTPTSLRNREGETKKKMEDGIEFLKPETENSIDFESHIYER